MACLTTPMARPRKSVLDMLSREGGSTEEEKNAVKRTLEGSRYGVSDEDAFWQSGTILSPAHAVLAPFLSLALIQIDVSRERAVFTNIL